MFKKRKKNVFISYQYTINSISALGFGNTTGTYRTLTEETFEKFREDLETGINKRHSVQDAVVIILNVIPIK